MIGVENLVKLASAVGQLGTLGYDIMEDGKISLRDLGHIREALVCVRAFMAIDYKSTLPEIKDLSDAEVAELSAAFNASLKIGGGTTERAVEDGLAMIVQILEVIAQFIDWGKSAKLVA
jgi:hypothetical protein